MECVVHDGRWKTSGMGILIKKKKKRKKKRRMYDVALTHRSSRYRESIRLNWTLQKKKKERTT